MMPKRYNGPPKVIYLHGGFYVIRALREDEGQAPLGGVKYFPNEYFPDNVVGYSRYISYAREVLDIAEAEGVVEVELRVVVPIAHAANVEFHGGSPGMFDITHDKRIVPMATARAFVALYMVNAYAARDYLTVELDRLRNIELGGS